MGRARGRNTAVAAAGFDSVLGRRRGTGETEAQAETRDPMRSLDGDKLLADYEKGLPWRDDALAIYNGRAVHGRPDIRDRIEHELIHDAVGRARLRLEDTHARAAKAFGLEPFTKVEVGNSQTRAWLSSLLALKRDRGETLTWETLDRDAEMQLAADIGQRLATRLAHEDGWRSCIAYEGLHERYARKRLRKDHELSALADHEKLPELLRDWVADDARHYTLATTLAAALPN